MFVAYQVSIELIGLLRPLLPEVKRCSADLASQLERAATSVALNLGEGRCRRGGDQRRFYAYAHGSASEVRAALEVADAWGWAADTSEVRARLDRLLAMLWRLTHAR